MLIDLKGKE
ncbi:hypothetical protein CLOP_g23574, partial [Closterium sp. NIES-67]